MDDAAGWTQALKGGGGEGLICENDKLFSFFLNGIRGFLNCRVNSEINQQ